jgi:hypothetical protein
LKFNWRGSWNLLVLYLWTFYSLRVDGCAASLEALLQLQFETTRGALCSAAVARYADYCCCMILSGRYSWYLCQIPSDGCGSFLGLFRVHAIVPFLLCSWILCNSMTWVNNWMRRRQTGWCIFLNTLQILFLGALEV